MTLSEYRNEHIPRIQKTML